MTPRARAAIHAFLLAWLLVSLDGCDGEREVASIPQPPEGGSELAKGPVVLVGVTRPCSARFTWSYAKVLLWEDGVVLVGPLEELRWRWCMLSRERVAVIRDALHRAGVAESRPPAMVKHDTAYLIVGCRQADASGVAWIELESPGENELQARLSTHLHGLDAPEVPEALRALLDLVEGRHESCLPFESDELRSVALTEYGDLWGFRDDLRRR